MGYKILLNLIGQKFVWPVKWTDGLWVLKKRGLSNPRKKIIFEVMSFRPNTQVPNLGQRLYIKLLNDKLCRY